MPVGLLMGMFGVVLGVPLAPLGHLLDAFGLILGVFGRFWARLGHLLGAPWLLMGIFRASLAHLERLGAPLGRLLGHVGPLWLSRPYFLVSSVVGIP